MAKILLVDDNDSYRHSIQALLEAEGYEVVAVGDPITGIEKVGSHYFDLLISDLEMNEMNGNDFVEYALRIAPKMKTIILTGRPTSESELTAIDNQVNHYLTKDAPLQLFLKYIERVLLEKNAQERIYSSTVENLVLNVDSRIVTINDEPIELTKREFQVLELLLENKGKALSRMDFFEAIWDVIVEDIDERTIDVHIKQLRRKLKISSIVTVRGYGYKWEE